MYQRHRPILAEIDAVLAAVAPTEVDALCLAIAKARRIVLSGAGRVGLACRGFAMRLAHLGRDAHMLGDATVPAIGAGDLLLIASGSGETPTMKLIAETGRRNGAALALITARRQSGIAALADTLVILPAPSKAGLASAGATASAQPMTTLNEQCLQIFFDALVLQLMAQLGQTAADMWARHSNLE